MAEAKAAGIPEPVADLAHGQTVEPVWLNMVGGITFELDRHGRDRCFVKWSPLSEAHRLVAEAPRLEWAARFTTVPRLLGQGADDEGAWLITSPLPGSTAVAPRWIADPATAVTAIGKGLRALHDALPVERCPFTWSAQERVAAARSRVAAGLIDREEIHEDYRHLILSDALAQLADPPAVDRVVVCHGDACAPNTMIDESGRCCGHVDLGSLGVGDRWADLAIATWSATWNFGPGWEQTLLEAYGVATDRSRTHYYRLLWELGP